MPELPEVETVRRGLAPFLEGRRLTRVTVRRRDLRQPVADDFEARLTGRRIRHVARRAKYLLVHLDGEPDEVLIVHLGMSGRMTLTAADAVLGRHDHVLLRTDGGDEIRFTDPRRFGLMTLCREADLDAHPLLARLGLDPLSNRFDGEALGAALKGRATPLKSALMDQRIVAGLGNIYVCESLYRAGLSPRRRAGSIVAGRAERLAAAIGEVLRAAIDAGGSSLRDHVRPDGELGYFQTAFAVYGRAGEPCPGCDCGGGIGRFTQAGRSTFYCARRQR